MSIFNYENKKPQIPSCASEGRRHVCPAGIRGYPLPKGNRDADERIFVYRGYFRLIERSTPQRTQRTQSVWVKIFAAFAFWYEKINNELGRTLYELTLPEFVSVRISSLFFLCSFMKHGFIADFAVKTFVFDGSDAL